MTDNFYAHGKLLLTGEYFVLDGALALALPCKRGQSMAVKPLDNSDSILKWKSLDHENSIWFEAEFDTLSLTFLNNSDQQTAETLQQIFRAARLQNPAFLNDKTSFEVETKLEFPRQWGLGSSSTLIYNIAQWSKTNAFQLLSETMGGSGYDIACAGAEGPVLYQKTNSYPIIENCTFNPLFREQLYFVYLEKKQNSREGISLYHKKVKRQPDLIDQVSRLTKAVLDCTDFFAFESLLLEHEELVSKALELPRIQDQYFPDFSGVIKSLGAWGGDFILATSTLGNVKAKEFFNEKGFDVLLKYDDLIL